MTLHISKESSGIRWSLNEGLSLQWRASGNHTPIHALRDILSRKIFMKPMLPFENDEFQTMCCIESARVLCRKIEDECDATRV